MFHLLRPVTPDGRCLGWWKNTSVCLCLFVEWLWPFSFLFHGRSDATNLGTFKQQLSSPGPLLSCLSVAWRSWVMFTERWGLGWFLFLAGRGVWGPAGPAAGLVRPSLPLLPTVSVRPLLSPVPSLNSFPPFFTSGSQNFKQVHWDLCFFFHNLIMWLKLLLALQKYSVIAQMWLLIKKSLVRENGFLGDVLSKIMPFRKKKVWVHKILSL